MRSRAGADPGRGNENADTNPPRVAPHNLSDLGAGLDNILHKDRYKLNLRFTVLNLANKEALYNFLPSAAPTL